MAVRLFVAICLLFAHVTASAQSPAIQLGPDNSFVSFELPAAAFGHEGASLSVDLDGYDVTGFASLDGVRLTVNLEVPLEAGEHSVAVFLFHASGDAEIVFEGQVEAPVVASSDWSFNTMLETNYRAADDPSLSYAGVDKSANSGSIAFSASRSRGNWGAGASLETIYDQASGALPGGKDWLLPSYELYAGFAGESTEAWGVIGNIAVSRDDLLYSAYQRRGIALEGAALGRLSLKAFSVHSQPRNGFDGDYLAPTESNGQTNGLSTTLKVIDGHLQLAGGFVDGKSSFGGDGFNPPNDTLVYGGDSWNLALDAWALDDSLWLHLENAESDFDADGIGVGMPALEDDAFQALVQLSSNGKIGTGPFEFWSATLQHKRVGRDFYTLGNLSLPGNLESTAAWLQAGFTSVVIDIELAEENTNPEKNPLFARQTIDRRGATLSWAPVDIDAEAGPWRFLGVPSATAWYSRTDNQQPDAIAQLVGFDVDNSIHDTGVSIMFARDALTWGIEVGNVDYFDYSMTVIDNGFIVYEPYSDSRNRHLTANVAWMPHKRVALDAYLQRNHYDETAFNDRYRTTNYGIGGNFVLVPERLGLYASFSRGKDRSIYGDPQFTPDHFESDFASLQLNWKVLAAADSRPSIDLFLKANYGRDENVGLMLDDDFSAIYIGGTVNWTGSK